MHICDLDINWTPLDIGVSLVGDITHLSWAAGVELLTGRDQNMSQDRRMRRQKGQRPIRYPPPGHTCRGRRTMKDTEIPLVSLDHVKFMWQRGGRLSGLQSFLVAVFFQTRQNF